MIIPFSLLIVNFRNSAVISRNNFDPIERYFQNRVSSFQKLKYSISRNVKAEFAKSGQEIRRNENTRFFVR